MEIKVIALTTTQQILISQIDEVAASVPGEPDCKLVNPFWINTFSLVDIDNHSQIRYV